jgi:hypothetical protein
VQYLHARAAIIGVIRVDERIRAFRSFDVYGFVLSKTRNVHFGSRGGRVRRGCQRKQILRFHICRPGKRHSRIWKFSRVARYKRNLGKYPCKGCICTFNLIRISSLHIAFQKSVRGPLSRWVRWQGGPPKYKCSRF